MKHSSALAVFALFLLTSTSCSLFHGGSNKNTISPYDKEFNPDEEEAKNSEESDLPESELLNRAKNAYDRGLYSVARENWTKWRESYPSSFYATLAQLKIADTFFFAGDYAQAISTYEEFLKLHPGHEAIPYVRYQIGLANEQQHAGLGHDDSPLKQAIKAYRSLIEEFPNNEFSLLARRALDNCRDKLAEQEATIARFYGKQGAKKACATRLREMMNNYPDSAVALSRYKEITSEYFTGENELLSLAGEGKSKIGGATPKAPLVVSKNTVPTTAQEGARFRMLESEKNNTLAPQDTKPSSPEIISAVRENRSSFEPFQGLACEESEQFYIFTAYFKESVRLGKLALDSSGFNGILTNEKSPVTNSGEVSSSELSKPVDSCNLQGVALSLLESASPKKGLVSRYLAFRFNQADQNKIHYFTLDRPYRFVLLLEK